MRAKLGLTDDDPELYGDLMTLLAGDRVDFTSFFRRLAAGPGSDDARALFAEPAAFDAWHARWRAADPDTAAMNRANPVYIPRNHLVEEALAAATDAGDLRPVTELLAVLADPYDERPGLDRYAAPAPAEFGPYQTFCGT
jgi:serine/tyrosine/threonine adenylyltransferase